MPPVFGELGERLTPFKGLHKFKENHWGVIGFEDAEHIIEEVTGDEPDAHLHWFVAVMFVRSLIKYGGYSKPEDYYWLWNSQGNCSHAYFKLTHDLIIALSAVECYEEAVRLAPDDMNRASTEHNIAIGINSILVRYHESIQQVEEIWGRSNLQDAALAAAARAMAVFEEQAKKQPATLPTQDPSAGRIFWIGPAQQVARLHHLMGDLLSVLPTDDAHRRKAIEHYTEALKTPSTPQLTAGLRRSLCGVLVSLEHPTEDEICLAEAELRQMTQ